MLKQIKERIFNIFSILPSYRHEIPAKIRNGM